MESTAQEILVGVKEAIQRANPSGQPMPAIDPGHRHSFHWPPHAISRDYHVTSDQWNESSDHQIRGETYEVHWATNDHGIFGRIIDLWNEAKGSTKAEVLIDLEKGAAPWLDRMDCISESLGFPTRFHGRIRDLESPQLASLLFASDRDVAYSASTEIEKRASQLHFADAFIAILRDHSHPNRRTAQWCVLDMLEDHRAFCKSDSEVQLVVDAILALMMTAPDDYARTIYKAGVVLGGHFCNEPAAEALITCINAPSKIGRRSAMHAVFHLVEWLPHHRTEVVNTLVAASDRESDPMLKEFALSQANDIREGASEHKEEPVFPEEISS
ncbi:MAG: hypothetical protein ACKVQS_12575 [Fimbriimonadaceae bacterium]